MFFIFHLYSSTARKTTMTKLVVISIEPVLVEGQNKNWQHLKQQPTNTLQQPRIVVVRPTQNPYLYLNATENCVDDDDYLPVNLNSCNNNNPQTLYSSKEIYSSSQSLREEQENNPKMAFLNGKKCFQVRHLNQFDNPHENWQLLHNELQ